MIYINNMAAENVYVALIINANNYPNLSQYDIIISLLNNKFPNNKLSYYKYLTDGSTIQTTESLDNFIDNTKFSLGKRAVVSITTTILTDCSTYISSKGLNILNISINATSNNIKNLTNTLTYTPLNQYSVMSMFMTYVDFKMDYIHVLYGESSNIGLVDFLEQTRQQASFLNIPLEVSTLRNNVSDYNIKPKSMIIMLGLTNDLTNIYITPDFISKIPTNCYITLTTANTLITDIFGPQPGFARARRTNDGHLLAGLHFQRDVPQRIWHIAFGCGMARRYIGQKNLHLANQSVDGSVYLSKPALRAAASMPR